MERVITPEERIRRAEEIYYRRRAQGVRVSTASVNVGKGNKVSLGRKMGIQILACILIYMSFWMIKGYNNVFSENVINKTKDILNYDVNFANLYNQCVEYFNKNFNNIIKSDDNQNNQEKNSDGDSNENPNDAEVGPNDENVGNDPNSQDNIDGGNEQNNSDADINTENTNIDNGNAEDINGDNVQGEVSQNLGMGGGNDSSIGAENDGTIQAKIDAENISQMEQDIEFIKQNCNIMNPLQGYITSGFGDREATEIISAFHQGVDISATTGTPFYAAMEGTVTASSYAGDYGNHIKIQNGDILTVYAHCSELEVNVGDYVNQGQEIGKVGATGNVTRATFAL